MTRVALFDYGAGNLHSLGRALVEGGARVTVTSDWKEALELDALVLSGVGSFGSAVRSLDGWRERVRDVLAAGHPCLGICLGMQLLFSRSEEGDGAGIGLVPGVVRRLRARTVPQIGWNDVAPVARPDAMPSGRAARAGPQDPLFGSGEVVPMYYANSFVCEPDDPGRIIARSTCEGDTFAAAIRVGRTWGMQFHPEKSSRPGLRIVRGFVTEAAR